MRPTSTPQRLRLPSLCLAAITSITLSWLLEPVASIGRMSRQQSSSEISGPTYYRDVLPILRDHCTICHRTGGIAPMSFETYQSVWRYSKIISTVAREKSMPPAFAIPLVGRFSNDPSLSSEQISTLATWANQSAPEGDPREAPPDLATGSWTIPKPDLIVRMPKPIELQPNGNREYVYEIVPTQLSEDRWVQMAEVLPTAPKYLRQAVVFIRRPGSNWLKHAPVRTSFTSAMLGVKEESRWTDDDILTVFAPGSPADVWPGTMGKLIPRGADLIFRMEYASEGNAATDQSSVGIIFSKNTPAERVITLALANYGFVIPPEIADYRVEANGTIGKDATMLSLFPEMHLRGKRFEYDLTDFGEKTLKETYPKTETLLRINYDPRWHVRYLLLKPRPIKAGTNIHAVAWYDNSPNNPHNPDPKVSVRAGNQATEEVLLAFFEVAVPSNFGKHSDVLRLH